MNKQEAYRILRTKPSETGSAVFSEAYNTIFRQSLIKRLNYLIDRYGRFPKCLSWELNIYGWETPGQLLEELLIAENLNKMNELKILHDKAMELSDLAFVAKRGGDLDAMLKYSIEALEYEEKAAALLQDQVTVEPTRSILYRSAASLAIDCNLFKKAEELISIALTEFTPKEIAAELAELKGAIN